MFCSRGDRPRLRRVPNAVHSRSWLTTRAVRVRRGPRDRAGTGPVTVVVSLLAALATVGWLVPAGWWSALVLGAAAGSAALLLLCFSPTGPGLAIDAASPAALAGPWSPGG
jgi:hypothetical protein